MFRLLRSLVATGCLVCLWVSELFAYVVIICCLWFVCLGCIIRLDAVDLVSVLIGFGFAAICLMNAAGYLS